MKKQKRKSKNNALNWQMRQGKIRWNPKDWSIKNPQTLANNW